jgi:hypothetical protein
LSIGSDFFVLVKNKILQFCGIYGNKKDKTQFFPLSSFVVVLIGSGIRDWKIRIRDKHPGSATLLLKH